MKLKQISQQKPKARNGKQLMSELLTDARKYIEQAEQTDIESLRQFLYNEPERPLIAMGHGGSHSSAAFAALLYGTNSGLGRAMTPYQANSLSDATLKNSKQLLVSKSLKNQDVVFIAKRINKVNPDNSYVFQLPFDVPDGFISIDGTFAYFSLLYKAFTGDANISDRLALSPISGENYTYRCVDGVTTPPDLGTITQFTVLYGSYGEPVAHKMESNMTEAGLASCVISDYRDECHGRFLALSNFIQSKNRPQTDCALVLLVTPREESLCHNFLKCLPAHLPIVLIRTDIASPLGAIDLLYKMSIFTSVFGEQYRGSNPNDPNNLGGFDKRAFRNNVRFSQDFRLYGSLSLTVPDILYTDRLCL